nr:sodium channel subunit beta-4 [Cavia porcellus]
MTLRQGEASFLEECANQGRPGDRVVQRTEEEEEGEEEGEGRGTGGGGQRGRQGAPRHACSAERRGSRRGVAAVPGLSGRSVAEAGLLWIRSGQRLCTARCESSCPACLCLLRDCARSAAAEFPPSPRGRRSLPSPSPECGRPEEEAAHFRGNSHARGRAPSPLLLGLLLLPVSLSLEVSVGKATTIYAVNGTEILLPCTFSSCFGFEDLRFWWSYNSSDTSRILIDGTVKNEKSDPKLKLKDDDRITLVGTTKEKKNNISILLRDLEFSDSGKYTCHVRNPKEKDLEHQATIILQVVDKCPAGRSSVTSLLEGLHPFLLGGTAWTWLLGTVSSAPWPLPCWNNWVPLSLSESLLRVCPLLHALTPRGDRALAMSVVQLRNLWKECLVSSSGNDNTENGLPGSKAEEKPPTKV